MQELIPAIWDDLDYADGSKVPAETFATLSYNGLAVELDLTREHDAVLAEFLTPYLKAGRKTQSTTTPRWRAAPGNTLAEKRAYNHRMKDWADQNGMPYTTGPGPSKKIYWPKKTRDAYAAHLRSLGQ